jgi:HlyD family secretion protein
MGWLRHPGILTAALLTAGLLAWGFWSRPVPVEMVRAERGALTVTIDEDGRTRVIDRYEIRAPVAGFASRVDLDVGDPVSRGQVLLGITPLQSEVLDPRSRAEAEARVAAAEAALASTRENAEAAKARAGYRGAELGRVEPLAEKGVVSREVLDQARMERLAADAALRAAEHAVSVARYELEAARTALAHSGAVAEGEPAERVPVLSPIDGRVLAVQRECEGPVSQGELLLVVGDPSRLEVEVDLLSADAVRVQPGTRVLLEQWGGTEPLEGVVRTVEPVGFTKVSALGVEEQRVLVIADFTSSPERWQRLGHGYRVEARFVLWHHDDVLQVPASSLFRIAEADGGGWALFRVEDGRAGQRRVEVGQRNGIRAEIRAGLEPGDLIIDHASDAVADGVRVVAR